MRVRKLTSTVNKQYESWKKTKKNEHSECTKLETGIDQKCVLSLDFFSEKIVRKIEALSCVIIQAHNLNSQRYADNNVLSVDSKRKLIETLYTEVIERFFFS